MRSAHTIEKSRIETQFHLDSGKTRLERNKLGQFATPPDLAMDIIRASLKYLSDKRTINFLDPAFGTGSFYSAIIRNPSFPNIIFASGIEIDPYYGDVAKHLWSNGFLQMHITDFFSAPIPDKESNKPNFIVCNPPYVRHHHLSTIDKSRYGDLVKKVLGSKLNGLAGLYCYFLIYAHNWLSKGGIGCWLIPSEFMDVNYGADVKKYLLNKVTLLRVHRFDPKQSLFDDALVSSAVVWFKKSVPPVGHKVNFTFGGTSENPLVSKTVLASELVHLSKWTGVPFSNGNRINLKPQARLKDLFDIKRGLATGANDFFILTPEQIQEHNLPQKFLIPILPSPRHYRENIIESDKKGNPVITKKQFLLSCNLPASIVKKEYPTLWKYYEKGRGLKIHEGYICSHRTPWYAQEERPSSLFLCSYMGRSGTKNKNPFRFILNHSKATVANTYLILYPKSFLAGLIQKDASLINKIWENLNEISVESLVTNGRVYGGGLHKMEPKELANIPTDGILTALSKDLLHLKLITS